MIWNYRLVRYKGAEDDVCYGIHEAYYDNPEDIVPKSITKKPARIKLDEPTQECLDNLYTKLQSAVSKPILDYNEF